MASIFKPTITDKKTGKKKKSEFYRIEYKDEHGRRQKVLGFKDKSATQAKARDIERKVERIKAGLQVKSDQIITFANALDMYLDELVRRGSPRDGPHVKEVHRQLTTLAKECAWPTVQVVRSEALMKWLAGKSAEGRAPRTLNHYQTRLRSFLDWCVQQRWLEGNPIAHLRLAKVGQKGRKRLRRAYSRDEMERLLVAAPEPRRTIYQIARLSGLRRKELKRLQKQDCTPIGDRPCWHLRPEIEKAGRGDKIPMLAECAKLLRPIWEQANQRTGCLFKTIPGMQTMYGDLKTAGIERQDERGRWADFHSFRYTFCTEMGRKLPIQYVKILMRHSTIQLTADLYTDLGIDGAGKEIWELLGMPPAGDSTPPASAENDGGKSRHSS